MSYSQQQTRSFNGCWTCRLRRKKCDEARPVCQSCTALHIGCHFDRDKPEWMDGGTQQEEMAEQVKREIKANAHLRRGERATLGPDGHNSRVEASSSENMGQPPKQASGFAISASESRPAIDVQHNMMDVDSASSVQPSLTKQPGCRLINSQENTSFDRSDTVLLTFYLEHVLPFLFPFYRPSAIEGGRAWILEMIISSPVVRRAMLCQTSYFFSLAQELDKCDIVWGTVLARTKDAFDVLGKALGAIESTGVAEHLDGAVRILASIMQVQRFEIAVLSFENCQAHLNAALALFGQLLDSTGVVVPADPGASFNTLLDRLGPSAWVLPTGCIQVPSAEQAALHFSSALLILDDIVASTILQEQPKLYEFHQAFLGTVDDKKPLIDLESVVGCQNWTLLKVGEIAVLDAWKQRCKRSGNLNVIELVQRATIIKDCLEARLGWLENNPVIIPEESRSLLDVFTAEYSQRPNESSSQSALVTRIWAHSALVYLHVVVSGWQTSSVDVRFHVGQILELVTQELSPPAVLRTMVWPFCVAGCLAEPAQENQFRALVDALQPSGVFRTVRKAFEVMEHAWRNRNTGDIANRDLATCFRSQGNLVMLV